MQDFLCDVSPRGSERRGSWMLTIMAAVLLSFGVGAATAAFTLVSAGAQYPARFVACETMLQLSDSPFAHQREDTPSANEVQERVSEAYRATYESSYQLRYEAAGNLVSSLSDVTDDLDAHSLAPLFAAGALAMLVACARMAACMLSAPHAPAVAAVAAVAAIAAIGALFVSAVLVSVLGLPAMGLRAVAFALCVSLLAARFARAARNNLLPATA
jgi:hypothetical protein